MEREEIDAEEALALLVASSRFSGRTFRETRAEHHPRAGRLRSIGMGTDANGSGRQWELTRRTIEEAGLKVPAVWLHYFSLSGDIGEYELEAYLNGRVVLPPAERDLVSHAVNELIDQLPPHPGPPTAPALDPNRRASPSHGRTSTPEGTPSRSHRVPTRSRP